MSTTSVVTVTGQCAVRGKKGTIVTIVPCAHVTGTGIALYLITMAGLDNLRDTRARDNGDKTLFRPQAGL